LVGERVDGHTFHVHVEECSGCLALVGGMDVDQPWLRAACSCGWRAANGRRYTLEENAHWLWHLHVAGDNSAGDRTAHIDGSVGGSA
jgi:hypothetical protein